MKKSNKRALITSGFHIYSNYERPEQDFYFTDPIAIELLLKYETFSNVWEPACGEGNLSKVLKKYNLLKKESDLYYYEKYPTEQIDFIKYEGEWDGDIITNPPFSLFEEFVRKGFSLLKEGRKMAFLAPQRYFSSISRYYLFQDCKPSIFYIFSKRIGCYILNKKNNSSPAIDFMWIVWKKGENNEPIVKWFEPNY